MQMYVFVSIVKELMAYIIQPRQQNRWSNNHKNNMELLGTVNYDLIDVFISFSAAQTPFFQTIYKASS